MRIDRVQVDGRNVEGCQGAVAGPGMVLRVEDITITFGPGSVVAGNVYRLPAELRGILGGYPGKRRPGQWGARARTRRARRLERAAERSRARWCTRMGERDRGVLGASRRSRRKTFQAEAAQAWGG